MPVGNSAAFTPFRAIDGVLGVKRKQYQSNAQASVSKTGRQIEPAPLPDHRCTPRAHESHGLTVWRWQSTATLQHGGWSEPAPSRPIEPGSIPLRMSRVTLPAARCLIRNRTKGEGSNVRKPMEAGEIRDESMLLHQPDAPLIEWLDQRLQGRPRSIHQALFRAFVIKIPRDGRAGTIRRYSVT